MTMKQAIVVLLAAGLISACGGGGDSPALTPDEVERAQSDPRVVRVAGIAERANTLVIPAAYYDFTVSVQGQSEHVRLPMSGSCVGTRCVLSGGGESVTIHLEDLLIPSDETEFTEEKELTEIELGHRVGMDTAFVAGRSRLSENLYGESATATLSLQGYAVWGEYGFAAVDTVRGPFSGTIQGVAFTGDVNSTSSYVFGRPTGYNPSGFGSATWRGAAEAVSTRSYQRRGGTATITMADLSVPWVAVDVTIDGYPIGSPAWDRISLYNGRFATGSKGRDRLVGDFYGPAHEEGYGAFDTGAYVGAFGTRRVH